MKITMIFDDDSNIAVETIEATTKRDTLVNALEVFGEYWKKISQDLCPDFVVEEDEAPLKKFSFQLEEIRRKTVTVEASDYDIAYDKIYYAWRNGEVTLTKQDKYSRSIRPE